METETRLNFPHKRQGVSYYQLLPSDQENINLNYHNTVQDLVSGHLVRNWSWPLTEIVLLCGLQLVS